MSIIVTGAAGFIGSNLVRALNERGVSDIIAVDHLTEGNKFRNLADLSDCRLSRQERISRALCQARIRPGHSGAA